MVCRPNGPRVMLRYRDDADEKAFVWSATPDGWLYLTELITGLCWRGGVGHHYLAEDKDDVALIELSVGEEEVLRSLKNS